MSRTGALAFLAAHGSSALAFGPSCRLAVCLCAFAWVLATQAGCQQLGAGDPDGGALDAGSDARPDARREAGPDASDAGGLDAHPWGLDPEEWAVEHPPCDATEIQLPPTGRTTVFEPQHMNGKVVYSDHRDWDQYYSDDIFLYDLATCIEYRVTKKHSGQIIPYIWEDSIVFTNFDYPGDNARLVLFVLGSLTFTKLQSQSFGGRGRYNGRFILYDSYEETIDRGKHLTLWDLVTDEEIRLAEDWQGAENVSLSPTHAAWVAWGGPDKDVFFANLETREVTHIQSTWDSYTAFTATWGDWVLWEDDRDGGMEIYGYRIATGEEVRVTDNGAWNGRPTLRGNIACYRTSLYDPTVGWNLVVRDMVTGVERRVTREPHVGYKCGDVESGWLIYQKQTGSDYWLNTIHAVDLVAAGILDPSGESVLPEEGQGQVPGEG